MCAFGASTAFASLCACTSRVLALMRGLGDEMVSERTGMHSLCFCSCRAQRQECGQACCGPGPGRLCLCWGMWLCKLRYPVISLSDRRALLLAGTDMESLARTEVMLDLGFGITWFSGSILRK